MDRLAEEGRISLLRNQRNLGFAASVNRALAQRRDEDVLLLNADTIAPQRLIERLSAAAYQRADTGTVTPLSNNGEYTSLPHRFRVNPMLEPAAAAEFDRRLAEAFGADTVEMPNGIGFCLFIRRSMLDAVGGLSTAFGRGYGEDIEFCLRGAAAGFRNLCSLGVYVPHEGGRSFGGLKRALVKRNLRRLSLAYTSYQRASELFVEADPVSQRLGESFADLCGETAHAIALGPAGFAQAFADPPSASDARTPGRSMLLIEARQSAGQIHLSLSCSSGGFPQALPLVLPADEALARKQLVQPVLAGLHCSGLWTPP